MYSSRCDMKGIGVGGLRQKPLLNNRDCQPLCRSSHLQERKSFKDSEPPCGRLWVAQAGLVHDQKRGNKVEVVPATLPPVERDLLMGCCDDIATRPGGEIADHGGLDVDPGLHEGNVSTPP